MPYKIANAIIFNLIVYFMTNLRREPGAIFFFLLMSFFLTLTMSMMFRTIGSVSRTLSQALVPAAILILAILTFTGFAIPTSYMPGWSRWISHINPVAYGFESIMVNEFHDRNFTCSNFIPSGESYTGLSSNQYVCTTVGSIPGSNIVNGDAYINSAFQYYYTYKWWNFWIIIGFMILLMISYLVSAELVQAKKSKGEVLVFQRGYDPTAMAKKFPNDVEAATRGLPFIEKQMIKEDRVAQTIQRQTRIFHWEDVCYDIKIGKDSRRILDNVDGWVKPGTLTALMGVSGAGKTTLLDVLATRVTMGVVTGEMLIDGQLRDQSFQRKTGYVQQQDLHLSTSTVREALQFSALLRQSAHIPRQEKLAYVDEVIKVLDMDEYADAVVGIPGEGLNVEQRKRLTIGVELAAKPELLFFLDEPTSGLDSQTSWTILDLLEKLTKNGQAILCTIHQPSAMLFQRFDRLLFLKTGGQTVYFGEIGENSSTLIDYFEKNGAPFCPEDANPAEWMLEVIGDAPGHHTDQDWFDIWRNSPEYTEVKRELCRLKEVESKTINSTSGDKATYREFAAPFWAQMWEVQKRVFQQYWRTPSYIYSKVALCVTSSLFIGFTFFDAPLTQQGLQKQMFAIFMLLSIFGQLVQQIMPHFVTQRDLYEVRERPAKTYSWKAFMLSNILVELPYQTLMAVIMYCCWYYPTGMYRNAIPTNTVHERGALMFLLILTLLILISTFAHMIIAAAKDAEAGGNLSNMMFSLCLIFCGVLAGPKALPGFWIFMYRVSPFTYLVSGILSTGVANTNMTCAANEYLNFDPPLGQTCMEYMKPYIMNVGGYLQDQDAISNCSYCTTTSTNTFLESVNSSYSTAWRNFGILWAYVVFNVVMALLLYWLFRVPDKFGRKKR
jgi:ATP-binding cassette subfamily G (WHITE) protein 2 (PDR)